MSTGDGAPIRWGCLAMIVWAASLTWCYAGCAPLHTASLPNDALRAIEAAQDGWRDAGLPPCDLGAVRVRYAAYPCASTEAGCIEQGVIVVRDELDLIDSTGGIVVHEWLHLARHRCGGGRDPGHTDPRVWSAAGGALSAQGRARDLLSLTK